MDTALAYFRDVVRLGSIRRAAEALNVSASSVSRHVQNLERALGAQLLQRGARGIKLTAEGEIVALFVENRSRELQRLRSSLDSLKGLKSGQVSICTVEGAIGGLLPRALAAFSECFPGVTFEVRVGSTDTVIQTVADERCDIGVAFHAKPRRGIEVVAVLEQPLLALMSPSHRLAKRERLALADFVGEQIGLPDSSFGIRHLIDHAVINGQFELPVRMESNSIAMLRQFVLHHMGVTFLPAFACEREISSGDLIAIPMTDSVFSSANLHICKSSETELGRAAHAFVETLLRTAHGDGSVPNFATLRNEHNASQRR